MSKVFSRGLPFVKRSRKGLTSDSQSLSSHPKSSLPKSAFPSLKFRSVRFEMSVLYMLIQAVILLVFSGVIYIMLSVTLYAELDHELEMKAGEISSNINAYLKVRGDSPDSLHFAVSNTIATGDRPLRRWWYTGFERRWFQRLDRQDLSKDYVSFTDRNGRCLVCSPSVTSDLRKILVEHNRVKIDGAPFFYNVVSEKHKLRFINYQFVYKGQEIYLLKVGVSPKPVVLLLQDWMVTIFLSIPVFLLLTAFMGNVLANRILKPVERLSALARKIRAEDLSQRLEGRYFYNEMDALVQSFNDMISQLEKSFHHVRDFSSHIAHELKTPLTIMRGETEVTLIKPRSAEEYQQTLKVNLEEMVKILQIIEDLLLLSRMENQPGCFKFQRIDFLEYFQDIYGQISVLASKKNIVVYLNVLENENPIYLNADPVHLRRLFFNLLDNAIKFSPVSGQVNIEITKEQRQVNVTIQDTGPGVSEMDIDKIFDPFYTSGARESGSGLGLGIVRAIAQAHHGQVTASHPLGQGMLFRVSLPTL